MLRRPAVAGTFYDSEPDALRETIEACFLGPYGPGKLPIPAPLVTRDILGLVCPHAGYSYSGYAAASAYYELAEDGMPETAVIIGPNHRGIGHKAAISIEGVWQTPLGEVAIDSEVAQAILSASDLLADDPVAHQPEHSIEVQLPFLQYLDPKIKIVPIVLAYLPGEDRVLYAEELGRAISGALTGRNAIVIASTDFTHYQPRDVADRLDHEAIATIESLSWRDMLDVVSRRGISMCGVVATAAALAACEGLGAKSAELLAYYTSGDIVGDMSQVVGYGALKIVRS